jgi:hypothetical protein
MAFVVIRKGSLIRCFDLVIKFLDNAFAQFSDERFMVESREQDSEASEDESGIIEIGRNSLSNAWILNLDCDSLPIASESAVHLTD